MLKNLSIILLTILCLSSFTTENVYTPQKLMKEVDKQVGKEVTVRGTVTHVCKHSGKKCFIMDDDGVTSLQVMAGGDITAFGQDLMGSEIKATGIIKEHRIEKEAIDYNEKEATEEKKHHHGEGSMEKCEAVLSNVKMMREWMEKNNKDYFAIYYVDGLKYEIVD